MPVQMSPGTKVSFSMKIKLSLRLQCAYKSAPDYLPITPPYAPLASVNVRGCVLIRLIGVLISFTKADGSFYRTCNANVVLCVRLFVYRLPCAAVKEDEPQLTDRGVEKVEHPFPSLLQSLAFSSSTPSRLRRMPVQHHLGIALASLSTQAIKMNEAEMRYNKADTHKKAENRNS